MKKQTLAEQGKKELEDAIDTREDEKKLLESKLIELECKIKAIENRKSLRKEIMDKKKEN